MKKFLTSIFISGSLLLCSCTNPSRSTKTLQNAGYTDIQIGGYNFFTCGQDDFYATSFSAKNPVGSTVSGTVCCGLLFKGCTVRF